MAYCPYSYFEYQMEAGETLSTLAKKFRVSEQTISEHNKGFQPGPGRRVRIPCGCGGCTRGSFYAIRRGETLYHIARRSGIDLADLLKANPYLNPNHYMPGQVIVIPPMKPRLKGVTYTVEDGEGVFDVLRKFHMDFTTFCMLNPDIDPMALKGGQRINIPPQQPKKGRWYTMLKDDTLSAVAQRYGVPVSVLLGLNEHLRPSEFKEGVTIRVPDK